MIFGAILRGGPFLFCRMGELLGEAVERGRPKTLQGARLKDLGIDYTQSHRYQMTAGRHL